MALGGGGAAGRLGQELAHRAGRTLRSASAGASGPPADTLRPGTPEVPGAPADRGEPLAPAWSTRLDGPTAPLELLVWLAGGRDQGVVAERRAAHPAVRSQMAEAEGQAGRGEGAAPLAPQGDGVRGPVPASPDRPSPSAGRPSPGLAKEDRSFPSRAADVFALLREAAPEPAAGIALPDQGAPLATAEFAPPAMAERLPPLTSPPGEGAPGLPVAAAMAWAGAQAKAAASEDDLDELAAKIKRILDEEARRYGIDV
jgi:hypothetical protein